MWPEPCPKLTLKSGFKTMIITIIPMLTGPTRLMTRPCLKSTLILGFKTMTITIFILICLSWTVLKLGVLYKDILREKKLNIVSEDMFSLYLILWKYKNSLQNHHRNKFIYIYLSISVSVSSTKYIFVFNVFIHFILG